MKKKTSLLAALLCLAVTSAIFVACFNTPHIPDSPILPGETYEHAAQRELSDLLNSTDGREMANAELVNFKRGHITLRLPYSEDDQQPRNGVAYVNADGDSLLFNLTALPDSAQAEGLEAGATMGTATRMWHFPKDTLQTYRLQSRGNSLHSLYLVTAVGNPRHPNGIASFEGMLIYVYPDGDSLMVSHGHLAPDNNIYRIH